MKKIISRIVSIIAVAFVFFVIVGSLTYTKLSPNSTADYPAAIMAEDKVYLLGEAMPIEIDESAIIGYTTSYTDTFPEKNGETNFNRELEMPYAKVEGGIAVLYENEWHLCTPKE